MHSCMVTRWEGGESRTSGKASLVEAVRMDGRRTGRLEMMLEMSLDQPRMHEEKWIHTGIVKDIRRRVDGWPE